MTSLSNGKKRWTLDDDRRTTLKCCLLTCDASLLLHRQAQNNSNRIPLSGPPELLNLLTAQPLTLLCSFQRRYDERHATFPGEKRKEIDLVFTQATCCEQNCGLTKLSCCAGHSKQMQQTSSWLTTTIPFRAKNNWLGTSHNKATLTKEQFMKRPKKQSRSSARGVLAQNVFVQEALQRVDWVRSIPAQCSPESVILIQVNDFPSDRVTGGKREWRAEHWTVVFAWPKKSYSEYRAPT